MLPRPAANKTPAASLPSAIEPSDHMPITARFAVAPPPRPVSPRNTPLCFFYLGPSLRSHGADVFSPLDRCDRRASELCAKLCFRCRRSPFLSSGCTAVVAVELPGVLIAAPRGQPLKINYLHCCSITVVICAAVPPPHRCCHDSSICVLVKDWAKGQASSRLTHPLLLNNTGKSFPGYCLPLWLSDTQRIF